MFAVLFRVPVKLILPPTLRFLPTLLFHFPTLCGFFRERFRGRYTIVEGRVAGFLAALPEPATVFALGRAIRPRATSTLRRCVIYRRNGGESQKP